MGVGQAGSVFPNLTVNGAAEGLAGRLPPGQVPLNQLLEDHQYWKVSDVHGWEAHSSILDPEECWCFPNHWVSVYIVQTSWTMPVFLKASVKSQPQATSWLSSDFRAYTKESDTLLTGRQFLPRRLLIVLHDGLWSLCPFIQPESLTTMVAKNHSCTELLPWQSSILHLSMEHQQALTSQRITFGCLESSSPQALLAVRLRRWQQNISLVFIYMWDHV